MEKGPGPFIRSFMSTQFSTIKESEARHLTGLIGSPISHSLSPMIHRQAFAQFAMDTYDYVLIEAGIDSLGEAVDAIKEDGRFVGFNITMPGKLKILDYCDVLSDSVQKIGCANTVKIEDGKLIAYNTDGDGFMKALRDLNVETDQKEMVIFGTGGAARAIKESAERNGCHVTLLHRPSDEETREGVRMADILVNATPLGMGGQGCIVEDLSDAKESLFVADCVYGDFTTDLIRMAQDKGLRNMNGLGMLYNQAFLSFGIWHGLFPG